MKSYKKLPSLKDLELVRGRIEEVGNRRGEFLRGIHYGCYLLCLEGGLRIGEAVKFDLKAKTWKGLYKIEKPKGKKERLVYVSKKVIRELKKQNWKPNQTNRFNFYHFLRKIKKELNISKNVELSPHTFRRAFTTYHANSGMPLPLLQKLLGHSSIRTTALYWKNIYGEDDFSDILTGKKWLERNPLVFDKGKEKRPKPPLPEISEPPIVENFPEVLKKPDSDIVKDKPLITTEKSNNQERSLDNFDKLSDNSLLITETEKNLPITNYQPKLCISEIPSKNQAEFSLTSEQVPVITSKKQKLTKEKILLTKIKDLESQLKASQSSLETSQKNFAEALQSKRKLKEQLTQVQNENKNLTIKLERTNYYEQQLKLVTKALYQWSKINYYKQLEQEAQIEQPPPFKRNK